MLRDRIMELVSLLRKEDLCEIEVRTFWSTIRVARNSRVSAGVKTDFEPAEASSSQTEVAPARPADVAMVAGVGTAIANAPLEPPAAAVEATAGLQEAELMEIVSPMVGTYYKASSPDAEPYVKVGQQIEVGQVICIIEAMKLMNEIESETSGIVRKILVKDSQPVEYGQPLFLIESA